MSAVKLTDEQLAVVHHEGGHARVSAVAGSGKTQTMTHRIRYLLTRGSDPRRLLVLMFNRSAREDFAERLNQLCDDFPRLPEVRTFHSLGHRLTEYFVREGWLPAARLVTEDWELKKLARECLAAEMQVQKLGKHASPEDLEAFGKKMETRVRIAPRWVRRRSGGNRSRPATPGVVRPQSRRSLGEGGRGTVPARLPPEGLGIDGWAEGAKTNHSHEPRSAAHTTYAREIEAGWPKPATGRDSVHESQARREPVAQTHDLTIFAISGRQLNASNNKNTLSACRGRHAGQEQEIPFEPKMPSFKIRTSRTGDTEFNFSTVNVLLGANGTGKSKLLQELQKDSETLFPGYTPVRIEGGRALEMFDSLELNNKNFGQFQTLEKIFSGFKKRRAQTLTSRLFHGLKALEQMAVDEKIRHSDEVVQWQAAGADGRTPKLPEDPMGRVFEIFNDIFPSITLRYRPSDRRLLCKKGGHEYGPTGLSDGEKQVFSILVDVIELAEEDSVLFVDEPELNLNPGLANRLWASIESLLPRSVFVYATHSVNFAMRKSVETLLVLSNDDEAIQEVTGLDKLSFNDQKELLGNIPALLAHSTALIVEGHDESFDSVFYRWLLADVNFLPAPVGGSEDVIAIATRAGKWAKISPEVQLTGIIDRDYKTAADIAHLEKKGLIVLDYHEAESYLCDPRVLHALANKLGTVDPIPTAEEITERINSYVKKNQIAICARRANDRLRHRIMPAVPAKTLSRITSFDDLERAFVADVESQMKAANKVFDKSNVVKVLKEEEDRVSTLESAFDIEAALTLLPAKELLASFADWFQLADANTLARAARTHLKPADFSKLTLLQAKLQW